MSESSAPVTMPTSVPAALVCRLRSRSLRHGWSPIAGEVELENVSATVLAIEVRSSPLQYLNLIVTDGAGNLVSESFYGDLFSPVAEPYVLSLRPGETFVGPVAFLGTVRDERQRPGEYTVRAVYEYRGLKAISEPLQVYLPAKKN